MYDKTEMRSTPDFQALYAEMVEDSEEAEAREEGGKRLLTLSVTGMPLSRFLQYITNKYGISIICDQNLDASPVTVDVVDTDIGDMLSAVARRFNVDITEQGNLYYLGNLKPEDRGFLVRKVRRLQSADIKNVLTSLSSEQGRVFVSSDGLVVVGDRVRVLQRMATMLDDVEKQPSNTWIVQLYLISTSDVVSKNIGFETSNSIEVSAVFADNTARFVSDGSFKAMLKAARESSEYGIVAEPMMLMVDSGSSTIEDGEKIPIARRTVSDAGTVTTTGYDYVNTGINITAGIREMSPTQASCSLSVDLTQVSGYVESSPITSGQTFKTTAVLQSGGTYLVGSMSKKSETHTKSGAFFNSNFKKSKNDGAIMIWLRCYRIQGGFRDADAASRSGSSTP